MDLPYLTKNNLKRVGIYSKKVDKKKLRHGAMIEMKEHNILNGLQAIRIAYDHLKENKDYYKK
jgi:hypothetical protein